MFASLCVSIEEYSFDRDIAGSQFACIESRVDYILDNRKSFLERSHGLFLIGALVVASIAKNYEYRPLDSPRKICNLTEINGIPVSFVLLHELNN